MCYDQVVRWKSRKRAGKKSHIPIENKPADARYRRRPLLVLDASIPLADFPSPLTFVFSTHSTWRLSLCLRLALLLLSWESSCLRSRSIAIIRWWSRMSFRLLHFPSYASISLSPSQLLLLLLLNAALVSNLPPLANSNLCYPLLETSSP